MVVALEGRLAGEWVKEFERTFDSGLPAHPLTLELSGLTYVDADGAALLRALASRGTNLVGGSAFVAALVAGIEK